MTVARDGLAADPMVDAPRGLAPILRFRPGRLSTSALASVRRVVDEDEAFRARVASSGSASMVGRAGELFLCRPAGWADELAALVSSSAEASAAAAESGAERDARRRLAAMSERAARAEEALVALRADLAAARSSLVAEQRARAAAEASAAALAGRVAGLEAERDAAHRRSAALAKEVERLTAEAGAVAAPLAAPDPEPAGVDPSVVEAVRTAVTEATAAADALRRALAGAADALGGPAPGAARGRGGRPDRAARLPRDARLPVTLPPGVFDDEVAAAEHLVRVAGVVVVVDGYNASLRRWPDEPLAEQRRRLVDVAAGLAARAGCEVHVVFDGGDDQGGSSAALARRGVRVTFSPAGVEADDVILDLVDRVPGVRPVVVVTGDRRVQREAAARGANLLVPDQLFSVR